MKDIKAMKVIVNYLYTIRQCLLLLVTVVFGMTGCSEETLVEPVSKEATVTLRFSQMGQVTTRVNEKPGYSDWCNANANECYIENCILLFYNWNGTYLDGFAYNERDGNIVNGSQGESMIKLDRPIPLDTQSVVILCNYGYSDPSHLLHGSNCSELKNFLTGTVTFFSYMTNFMDTDNGKKIPMFGFSNNVNSSYIDCTMYFSVAKIQLAISEYFYSDYNEYTWSLCNIPTAGNVYTDAGVDQWGRVSWDYVTPCFISDFTNWGSPYLSGYNVIQARKEYDGKLYVQHPDPTADKTYYCYSPEHQNSTRTVTGKIIDANTFDSDRTCIILRKKESTSSKVWYYRIDFLTGNGKDENKQFFDILRNRHYLVIVSKMAETGYATMEEALANPSSNIEYKIDGITEENTTSNGQYILDFTQEWNNLEYYEDNAVSKEVVIGYVKAIYADGVDYNITTNDISLSMADAGELELSDPDQKITTERIPIKIKLNKQAEGDYGWFGSFSLNLRLGNITRSFYYEISAKTGYVASSGSKHLYNFNNEEGIISIEDIPESFIQLNKSGKLYTLIVDDNNTSYPRTQSAVITFYNNPIYKYKFMITQRGKE